MQSVRTAPDTLKVTLTANSNGDANRLQQVRFGSGSNAVVDVGTRAESGSFTVTLPPGTADYSFTVKRVSNGAVTVPITVTDGCGDWKTFVGGGPGSF